MYCITACNCETAYYWQTRGRAHCAICRSGNTAILEIFMWHVKKKASYEASCKDLGDQKPLILSV
jgi:hypothetical protein